MKFETGYSLNMEPKTAVQEAGALLKAPGLIIYSAMEDIFDEVSRLLHERYPDSTAIGTTTCLSFTEAECKEASLAILAFDRTVPCSCGVIEEVKRNPMKYADRIQNCIDSLPDTENIICISFTVAFLQCEELVQQTLKKVLGDIPLVGISAGCSKGTKTRVALNGTVYSQGCAFLLMKNPEGRIAVIKENLFKPTRHIVTATNVDVENRIVYEYDQMPATEAMKHIFKVDDDCLSETLSTNPMGRISNDDIFITDFKEIVEDSAISYYARIYNNTKLYVMKRGDWKAVFEQTIEKIKKDIPKPSCGLVLNCASRSILFRKQGWMEEFAEGVTVYLGRYMLTSGYGEQMNGQHFNQTMVMVVFE